MVDAERAAAAVVFQTLASEYLQRPGVVFKRMFGSEALTVGGKIVGFVGRGGRLIVKLPAERCDELIAAGGAETVDLGHGVMREWVGVRPAASAGDTGAW